MATHFYRFPTGKQHRNNMKVAKMETNENFIVLLGAGASAFAKYRTFASFPDLLLKNRYGDENNLKPEDRNIRGLLVEINKQLRNSNRPTTHDQFLLMLTNYSALWKTLLTDSILRDRFLSTTHQFSDFISFSRIVNKTIYEITKETIVHYSENRIENQPLTPDFSERVFYFYKNLAKINSTKNPYLSVYTTNYDMLFEDLFKKYSSNRSDTFTLVNGFNNCSSSQRAKNGDTPCNKECFWTRKEYEGRLNSGLHYLRMHGCVSWFLIDKENTVVQCNRAQALLQPQQNLRIVMPGFTKSSGTGPQGYAFERFSNILIKCKILLIIGFSFQDDDILHLILSAIYRRKKPLKILVVDPSIKIKRVFKAFRDSQKRNISPSGELSKIEIKCVNCSFGIGDFDTVIMNELDNLN